MSEHRRHAHNDRGTTLVELLIVSLIVGVLASALAGSVILIIRTEKAAPQRFEESGGAQGLGTFLQADVQSAQSVELDFAAGVVGCTGTPNPTSSNLMLMRWSEPTPGSGGSYVAAYRLEEGGGGEWYVARYSCVEGEAASVVPVAGNIAPPPSGWAPGDDPAPSAAVTVVGAGNPADEYTLTLTTVSDYTYAVTGTRVNRPGALCSLVSPASMTITTGSPQPGEFTLAGLAPATLAGGLEVQVRAEVEGPACGSLRLNYNTGVSGDRAVNMNVNQTSTPFVATATISAAETWLPGPRNLTISSGAAPLGDASVVATVIGCQADVKASPSPVGLYKGLTTRAVEITAEPVDASLCRFPLLIEWDPTPLTEGDPLETEELVFDGAVHRITIPNYSAFDVGPTSVGTIQFGVYQKDSLDLTRFPVNLLVNDQPPACAFTEFTAPSPIFLQPGDLMPAGQRIEVVAEATCETPQIQYDRAGVLTAPADMSPVSGDPGRFEFLLPDGVGEVWTPGLKSVQLLSGTAANPPSEAGLSGSAHLLDVQVPCTVSSLTLPTPVNLGPSNDMPAGQVVTVTADPSCTNLTIAYQQAGTLTTPVSMTDLGGGAFEFALPSPDIWTPGPAKLVEVYFGATTVASGTMEVIGVGCSASITATPSISLTAQGTMPGGQTLEVTSIFCGPLSIRYTGPAGQVVQPLAGSGPFTYAFPSGVQWATEPVPPPPPVAVEILEGPTVITSGNVPLGFVACSFGSVRLEQGGNPVASIRLRGNGTVQGDVAITVPVNGTAACGSLGLTWSTPPGGTQPPAVPAPTTPAASYTFTIADGTSWATGPHTATFTSQTGVTTSTSVGTR